MDQESRDRMFERASELGRVISQTPEYAYLQSAQREIRDDEPAVVKLDRLRELQEQMLELVGRHEEPPEELGEEFMKLQEEIQGSTRYQSLISAQANFDKLMERVYHSIGKGIQKGDESPIIIPT